MPVKKGTGTDVSAVSKMLRLMMLTAVRLSCTGFDCHPVIWALKPDRISYSSSQVESTRAADADINDDDDDDSMIFVDTAASTASSLQDGSAPTSQASGRCCQRCGEAFSILLRQPHRCRFCARFFCYSCSCVDGVVAERVYVTEVPLAEWQQAASALAATNGCLPEQSERLITYLQRTRRTAVWGADDLPASLARSPDLPRGEDPLSPSTVLPAPSVGEASRPSNRFRVPSFVEVTAASSPITSMRMCLLCHEVFLQEQRAAMTSSRWNLFFQAVLRRNGEGRVSELLGSQVFALLYAVPSALWSLTTNTVAPGSRDLPRDLHAAVDNRYSRRATVAPPSADPPVVDEKTSTSASSPGNHESPLVAPSAAAGEATLPPVNIRPRVSSIPPSSSRSKDAACCGGPSPCPASRGCHPSGASTMPTSPLGFTIGHSGGPDGDLTTAAARNPEGSPNAVFAAAVPAADQSSALRLARSMAPPMPPPASKTPTTTTASPRPLTEGQASRLAMPPDFDALVAMLGGEAPLSAAEGGGGQCAVGLPLKVQVARPATASPALQPAVVIGAAVERHDQTPSPWLTERRWPSSPPPRPPQTEATHLLLRHHAAEDETAVCWQPGCGRRETAAGCFAVFLSQSLRPCRRCRRYCCPSHLRQCCLSADAVDPL